MPAPKKNKNAMKGDRPLRSVVHIRVAREDKSRWVKTAQRRGQTLPEYVRDSCNKNASVGGGPLS